MLRCCESASPLRVRCITHPSADESVVLVWGNQNAFAWFAQRYIRFSIPWTSWTMAEAAPGIAMSWVGVGLVEHVRAVRGLKALYKSWDMKTLYARISYVACGGDTIWCCTRGFVEIKNAQERSLVALMVGNWSARAIIHMCIRWVSILVTIAMLIQISAYSDT